MKILWSIFNKCRKRNNNEARLLCEKEKDMKTYIIKEVDER